MSSVHPVHDAEQAFAEGVRGLREGDLAGARGLAAGLLERHPDSACGHHLSGIEARIRGDYEAAEAALGRAIELQPGRGEAHLELARVHLQGRRTDLALDSASHALYLMPQSAEAYFEMGLAYRMQEEYDQAVSCLKSALEIDPAMVVAYTELGWIYQKLQRFQRAMDMYEGALELEPDNVDAQHQLGFVFVRCEQYAKGVELFTKVCERTPANSLVPRLNLANGYFHIGRHDLALRTYEQILAQEPNYFEARWNRAHLQLANWEFERGWPDYEFRFLIASLRAPRLIPFRPWQGEPLEGKSLVVLAEQGLGDQIMFSSCLPEVVARRPRRLLVECNHRLAPIIGRSFPEAEILPSKHEVGAPWLKDVGELDYQVYMGSLPGMMRRRWDDFPQHAGYLRAKPERVEHWKARLAELGPGLKVGLSWRGGTAKTRAAMRSIALQELKPVLEVPGCRFVSLQYGEVREEVRGFSERSGVPIAHWPEAIEDYDETAALCSALDLTISVCTAVIHLNGALGRPVWIMVPAVAEWRYGFAGERLPWYPSARMFRGTQIDVWAPVIERVARELEDLARNVR